ncbi:MAG: polysaccharide pyruvyl transferase family protein [Microbacteriaceae bacterium]
MTQFISTNLNIGNIMPVYAIQEMLGEATDVWNIHRPIDWDLINSSYESAIIGGAGLLHKVFEPFWADFLANCKLPFVIWGVGLCAQDASESSFCDPQIAAQVFERALAVNVRDEITAETYGFGRRSEISVTECPTVFYLRDFEVRPVQQRATLVIHPDLVSVENHEKARRSLELAGFDVWSTLNVATSADQIPDLIREYYCTSSLIVSSRLHGVITAYGLGIPYIAFAGDKKLREFHRLYGGGVLINHADELAVALDSPQIKLRVTGEQPPKPSLNQIEEFGRLAVTLLRGAQSK